MFRPVSTRWFEALCPRDEAVRAAAALARTGVVEIEVRSRGSSDFSVRHLKTGFAKFERYSEQYARYWPKSRQHRSPLVASPRSVLRYAIGRIEAWRMEADDLIGQLQDLQEECTRLDLLERLLQELKNSPINFNLITGSGPFLEVFCAILPIDADPGLPDWVLYRMIPWQDELCLMILGPRDRLRAVRNRIQAVKGRIVQRPGWLRGNAAEAMQQVSERVFYLRTQIDEMYMRLDNLQAEYALAGALSDLTCLDWFYTNIRGLEQAGRQFVWITGWTSDLSGQTLMTALEQAGAMALIRFASPPAGFEIPQILHNPPWMQAFEIFAQAMGIPGHDEADPTPLLALAVPLLFGYMFGDVGQGLVLILAGFWLRKRFPFARLMIAGGCSAIVFGFLFGSLFGREDLIPALWLHPLSAPVVVLAAPLVFAVGFLSLGLLLDAFGALWRRNLFQWLVLDAGFLVMYLGLAVSLFTRVGLTIALWGLVWYLVGAILWNRRFIGAFAAFGSLVENGLRLLVNTFSFARVGAFALAHASLSQALTSMADAAGSIIMGVAIMIVGNLVVIVLEGLVVSIQTTRLVLFEFFTRFLRGEGRVFRPLPVPPVMV